MAASKGKNTKTETTTSTTTTPTTTKNQKSTTEATTEKVVKAAKTTKSKKTEVVPTQVEPMPTTTTTTAATTTAATTTAATTTAATTTEPQVENVVVTSDTTSVVNQGFTEFISNFQSMLSQFSSLRTELKTLERQTMKQLKVVEKLNNKKKRGAKRKPSGFVKPSPISDELALFLGKEKGVEMARTDVTREINQYIRSHNLQDKANGRQINPDKALSTLLKITPESDVVLTYFNLQRYMGPHFPKSTKTETTA